MKERREENDGETRWEELTGYTKTETGTNQLVSLSSTCRFSVKALNRVWYFLVLH